MADMALLDDFQEVWTKHFEDFNTFLTRSQESSAIDIGPAKRGEYASATAAIEESKEYLRGCEEAYAVLDLEVRKNHSLPHARRSEYKSQIKVLRSSMEKQRRKVQELEIGLRQAQMGSTELLQRQALLHGGQIMDSTSEALLEAKQVNAQTEEVALSTADNLYSQGDQLGGVLRDLHETNAWSDRARRIAIGMARRMMTDRIIQVIIVIIELTILCILLWWKFLKK